MEVKCDDIANEVAVLRRSRSCNGRLESSIPTIPYCSDEQRSLLRRRSSGTLAISLAEIMENLSNDNSRLHTIPDVSHKACDNLVLHLEVTEPCDITIAQVQAEEHDPFTARLGIQVETLEHPAATSSSAEPSRTFCIRSKPPVEFLNDSPGENNDGDVKTPSRSSISKRHTDAEDVELGGSPNAKRSRNRFRTRAVGNQVPFVANVAVEARISAIFKTPPPAFSVSEYLNLKWDDSFFEAQQDAPTSESIPDNSPSIPGVVKSPSIISGGPLRADPFDPVDRPGTKGNTTSSFVSGLDIFNELIPGGDAAERFRDSPTSCLANKKDVKERCTWRIPSATQVRVGKLLGDLAVLDSHRRPGYCLYELAKLTNLAVCSQQRGHLRSQLQNHALGMSSENIFEQPAPMLPGQVVSSALRSLDKIMLKCDVFESYQADQFRCLANKPDSKTAKGTRCGKNIARDKQPMIQKLLAELRTLDTSRISPECLATIFKFTELAICHLHIKQVNESLEQTVSIGNSLLSALDPGEETDPALPVRQAKATVNFEIKFSSLGSSTQYLPEYLPYRLSKSSGQCREENVMATAMQPLLDTSSGQSRSPYLYVYWSQSFGIVKIGTSCDVARRMSEWRDSCKCAIELHYSSSSPVENARRVESLVQADLQDYRVFEPACQACFKSHIEWFRDMHLDLVIERIRLWEEWMAKCPYRKIGNQWFLTAAGLETLPSPPLIRKEGVRKEARKSASRTSLHLNQWRNSGIATTPQTRSITRKLLAWKDDAVPVKQKDDGVQAASLSESAET
ncbi:hypothetical protein MMC25_008182 [Agyrium rufum]|nr:hypothetical protein [Agyrium rufum]